MKTVNTREIPFRDQFRLRCQPVLHLVSVQRTLVHVSEVGASRHFVRWRREISFAGISRSWDVGRLLSLVLGIFIVLHKMRAGWTGMTVWNQPVVGTFLDSFLVDLRVHGGLLVTY